MKEGQKKLLHKQKWSKIKYC